MKYETFKAAVLGRLSEDIPDPKHITVQKIHRNNGEILDGLVILEQEVNIGPTLYLNHYYRTLCKGKGFEAVYRQILNSYEENKTNRRVDVSFFTEFEMVRSRIVVKLIHREKNMGLLEKNVPHIPFLDLAIVFCCMFPVDLDIGNATIQIDNSHLALWDKTVEALLPIAMENTQRLLPPKMQGINQVLCDLFDAPCYPTTPNPEDPLFPMYVLSNKENLYGAACIVYDGLIRSYADQFCSDLYILPSSIHEVILVPYDGQDRLEAFSDMVREVNETQVSPEDILSDHAYFYSRKRDEIVY